MVENFVNGETLTETRKNHITEKNWISIYKDFYIYYVIKL